MGNPCIDIPQDRIPELQKAIDKLNKRAEKVGCEPINLHFNAPFQKRISATQWATYVPVTIVGNAPKLNGWVFVATLEHDENGTLIRRLPAFDNEVDLTQYRKSTPDNCDHCGYRRRRNDTYIVWNEETGETKQVGSSCLKDFIGHDNPEAIARHLQNMRNFIEDVQGGSYNGGRITPRYDLRMVMAVAAAEVEEHGYVTRKQAWEDPNLVSTSEAVRTRWHRYLSSDFERDQIKPRHVQAASAAIGWVRDLSEEDLENEYLYNLFTVCKGDSIEEGQFGLAASAIHAAHRSITQTDGDRKKGQVTRTDDEPTEKQLKFIAKLAEELDSPYDMPETRLDASELINTMKAALAMSREPEQPDKKEAQATEKQLSFINSLMDRKEIPTQTRQDARRRIDAGLTKYAASKAIEWLQGFEDRRDYD